MSDDALPKYAFVAKPSVTTEIAAALAASERGHVTLSPAEWQDYEQEVRRIMFVINEMKHRGLL